MVEVVAVVQMAANAHDSGSDNERATEEFQRMTRAETIGNTGGRDNKRWWKEREGKRGQS
jgi:hypothetical protein